MRQFLKGVFLFLVLLPSAFASSEVCIDNWKNELTLSAHYYVYGDDATADIAADCIAEINKQFNRKHKILLNKTGDWLDIKVNVTHTLVSEKVASTVAAANVDPKVNFIRIDNPTAGSRVTVSEHGLGSNYGYFIIQNGLGYSTTCTHEFAHGLGLDHINPLDWRGKGVPPIMAARGTKVDKEFQYNPRAIAGAAGGTINPNKRQVHTSEFTLINMGDLKYRWTGIKTECAKQGKVVRKMYRKDGSMYNAKNEFSQAPLRMRRGDISSSVVSSSNMDLVNENERLESEKIISELSERLEKELKEGLQDPQELEGEVKTIID